MLKLIAIVIPLGLDCFAVAATLAVVGIGDRDRRRVMILFPLFEAGMPVVGLLVGLRLTGIAHAEKIAAAVLAVSALLVLRESRNSDGELVPLTTGGGLVPILALATAISVDELGIGLSLGLLGLPVVATLIVIAVQAVVMCQLGLLVGARLGRRAAGNAQLLSGILLLGVAVAVAFE